MFLYITDYISDYIIRLNFTVEANELSFPKGICYYSSFSSKKENYFPYIELHAIYNIVKAYRKVYDILLRELYELCKLSQDSHSMHDVISSVIQLYMS